MKQQFNRPAAALECRLQSVKLSDANQFTLEETRDMINAIFPTQTIGFYPGATSYGLKHLVETLSYRMDKSKYLDNKILVAAFTAEGFQLRQRTDVKSANPRVNVSGADVKAAEDLINENRLLFWLNATESATE